MGNLLIVNVVSIGVDSLTGGPEVCVTPYDGKEQCRFVDPFRSKMREQEPLTWKISNLTLMKIPYWKIQCVLKGRKYMMK
jgi:hypothetical protein